MEEGSVHVARLRGGALNVTSFLSGALLSRIRYPPGEPVAGAYMEVHLMRKLLALPPLVALSFLILGASPAHSRHVRATLQPVDGSGISGFVNLEGLPREKGTVITVHATGLTPGTEYLSLYYDNHVCELEPYSADDVIGHYVGDAGGTATVNAKVEDDLDEINSVSVRTAGDFALRACADVHPGG